MKAVLFDLGNTLAQYYSRAEWPDILDRAIARVEEFLRREQLCADSPDEIRARVRTEDYESPNYRVRPLEKRLSRIFRIPDAVLLEQACRVFLQPIFARGMCYQDTIPVLRELRGMGIKTAVVSNSPWGSPSHLWREEIERLGFLPYLDASCLCREVGWRKPARPIFRLALGRLRVGPQDCIFVGDHPQWDLAGARAVGMDAVLIDRDGAHPEKESIRDLRELPAIVELSR